ncbi:MAG: DUF460 domain-containing protein [Halobacteria archaeon]|nr:DUF460 domain-containing protein [Halobacteria archaeon]
MNTRTTALDALVFGVDVQSGDIRGDAPSYAVVAFDGKNIDRDVVSYRKLLRLIKREEPEIIATDNMYELAEDKDALIRFLRKLPPETKLVQVTGAERPESLSRVASRHNVPYGKKPIKEAEAAARLAANNVGYEVSAFTDKTRIKVSRGRSTGKGGWSQDRYTRRIHGAVRRRAREIEDTLDEKGFDYEMDVTEKYGGFANAEFRVEAPLSKIPVSSSRSGDVRVEVEPIQRDGIEFQPLAKRRDYVIVGIDPGTTTASAVVDLDGEVLNVMSTRTADTPEVIKWIIERGRPIIVAADVTPMPNTVNKIRSSFDAAGWTPESDISVDDKKRITDDYEYEYENDHQRDAIAAALFAYEEHKDQFERISRKIPPGIERDEVLARVIANEETVEAVLKDLSSDEDSEEEKEKHEPRELTEEEKEIKRLKKQVERLKSYVDELEEEVDEKEEEIEELKEELSDERRREAREIRKQREVRRLERKNEDLKRKLSEEESKKDEVQNKLERLKKLWKIDHSDLADLAEARDYTVVKLVDKFTKSAIEKADDNFGLSEGDVIYIKDASGAGKSTAEMVAEIDPRVVLKNGRLSKEADRVLFENDVPVGPAEDIPIREVDDLGIARETDIQEVIEEWEKKAEERELEEKSEMVDKLISEYRVERK